MILKYAIHFINNLTPDMAKLIYKCTKLSKLKRNEVQNQHKMSDIFRACCEPENYGIFQTEREPSFYDEALYKDLHQCIHKLNDLKHQFVKIMGRFGDVFEREIERHSLEIT